MRARRPAGHLAYVHPWRFRCLPDCLLGCLSICQYLCLPAGLLPVRLPACLYLRLPLCFCACLSALFLTFYRRVSLRACRPARLPVCRLPACPNAGSLLFGRVPAHLLGFWPAGWQPSNYPQQAACKLAWMPGFPPLRLPANYLCVCLHISQP